MENRLYNKNRGRELSRNTSRMSLASGHVVSVWTESGLPERPPRKSQKPIPVTLARMPWEDEE